MVDGAVIENNNAVGSRIWHKLRSLPWIRSAVREPMEEIHMHNILFYEVRKLLLVH